MNKAKSFDGYLNRLSALSLAAIIAVFHQVSATGGDWHGTGTCTGYLAPYAGGMSGDTYRGWFINFNYSTDGGVDLATTNYDMSIGHYSAAFSGNILCNAMAEARPPANGGFSPATSGSISGSSTWSWSGSTTNLPSAVGITTTVNLTGILKSTAHNEIEGMPGYVITNLQMGSWAQASVQPNNSTSWSLLLNHGSTNFVSSGPHLTGPSNFQITSATYNDTDATIWDDEVHFSVTSSIYTTATTSYLNFSLPVGATVAVNADMTMNSSATGNIDRWISVYASSTIGGGITCTFTNIYNNNTQN